MTIKGNSDDSPATATVDMMFQNKAMIYMHVASKYLIIKFYNAGGNYGSSYVTLRDSVRSAIHSNLNLYSVPAPNNQVQSGTHEFYSFEPPRTSASCHTTRRARGSRVANPTSTRRLVVQAKEAAVLDPPSPTQD
jgi:hypothetical protein